MAEKKVPSWDGDPDTFEAYKQKAEWYAEGLTSRERDTAGTRLAAALTGDAAQALKEIDKEERWKLKTEQGVALLLDYLEDSILDTPVPEAGRRLRSYLVQLRRNPGESMKVYASRHRTVLRELTQVLEKVEKADYQAIALNPQNDDEVRSVSIPPAEQEDHASETAEAVEAEGESGWGGWRWDNQRPWGQQWQREEPWRSRGWSENKKDVGKIQGIVRDKTVVEKAKDSLEKIMGKFGIEADNELLAPIKKLMETHRSEIVPGVLQGGSS